MSMKVQCRDCTFKRSPRDQPKAREHGIAHAREERGHVVEIVYIGEAAGTEVFRIPHGPDPVPVSDPEPFPPGKAPDAS